MPVVAEIQPILDLLAAHPVDMAMVTPEGMRAMYKAIASSREQVAEVGSVEDRDLDGPRGPLPVRIYRPMGDGPAPVLVWYHGGGWVIGDIDTADSTARRLCAEGDVVVVSVEYGLGPEQPYPAGPDDAWAALLWAAGHAAEIGGDPQRLAVGGDSAGGNLAALTALRARDEGGPALRHQLLVYPATDLTMEHPSITENGEGYFLTKATMLWFADQYLGVEREHGDPTSPAVSPLRVDDLSGVAPAQVLTAEYDPLRDEGDAYAVRLAEAGVPVDHVPHPGLIHGFFSMGAISPDADTATAAAIDRLRTAVHD